MGLINKIVKRVIEDLGALRHLQVGEVVELEPRRDEPALVWVGDRPKYLAWPFAAENGQLKLKLAGELPSSQEGRRPGPG